MAQPYAYGVPPQPQYYAGAPPPQQQQQYYAGAPPPQQQQQYYAGAQPQGFYSAPAPQQQIYAQQGAVAVPYAAYAAQQPGAPAGYAGAYGGAQQVLPAGAYGAGGAYAPGAGGINALTPEQQALVNEASWNDPSNWYMCETRYWGRLDSRFWVPPRRPGPCTTRVPNHAHPTYRKILLAVISILILSQVLRYALAYKK
jgi:hypothetical protein